MGRILVIAEKPSVGMTIAKALDVQEKQKGYIENDRYIISWCMGHLLELKPDPIPKEWRLASLPIIPTEWNYQEKGDEGARAQLHTLMRLMKRPDVTSLVCATDAGREGELIFRIVYNYAKCRKPFKRLWVSSLEEDAIRTGFRELKESKEYDNLYYSALARSRADWLVGINGTRLYTIGYGQNVASGKSEVFSVGRVQTPTLNMIVERQKQIDAFKVTKQWAVQKDFGTWQMESVKFRSEEEARTCLNDTHEKAVEITSIEIQKKKASPPKLYSLMTLQQDANKRFGFSAQDTLNIMQGLYEKKMISYPRTDSNYLTSDMEHTFTAIVQKLAEDLPFKFKSRGCKSVIDDSKVSDHYAVIVTANYVRNGGKAQFSEDEKKILLLIRTRMLASVSPAYLYERTEAKGICEGYEFIGAGIKEVEPGWKKIERNNLSSKTQTEVIFPSDFSEGKEYVPVKTTMVNRDTKPPKPYTEETLLGAMDRAGSEDMPEDAERKGLGTPATRAHIIERLLAVGYIERITKGNTKYLLPTEKGTNMIEYIDSQLKSPKLTADWEYRLKDIEKGKDNEKAFCEDIEKAVDRLVSDEKERIGETRTDNPSGDASTIGICPYCGAPFIEKRLVGECLNKDCGKVLFKDNGRLKGHVITSTELKKLIHGERVRMKLQKRNDPDKWYEVDIAVKTKDELTEEEKESKYIALKYIFDDKTKKKGKRQAPDGMNP